MMYCDYSHQKIPAEPAVPGAAAVPGTASTVSTAPSCADRGRLTGVASSRGEVVNTGFPRCKGGHAGIRSAKRWRDAVLPFFLIFCGSSPSYALGPPHNAVNGFTCQDCHLPHTPGFYPADDVAPMCTTCHRQGGAAESTSHVANHAVGNLVFDCGDCHNPHGPEISVDGHTGGSEADNLALIRNDLEYDMALDPVFQTATEMAFQSAPFNGICQSCHTQTAHQRNDGTGSLHMAGSDCTSCHPHEEGFKALGCFSCHDQERNGRRQIVGAAGDFQRRSHHVAGSVEERDCVVCHALQQHQQGTVVLLDPDLGEDLLHIYNPAQPESLEPFCLGCHDGDGAAAGGGLTPFSDDRAVPDIHQGGLWALSAHSSGGDTGVGFTCLGSGAGGCHSNAHGSNLRSLLPPYDGTVAEFQVNEEEGFCFSCHSDSGGVVNEGISNGRFAGTYENFTDSIEDSFLALSSHPVHDGAPGHDYAGGTELECTSCHGIHRNDGRYWSAVSGSTPVDLPGTAQQWGDDASEKAAQFDLDHTYAAPRMGEAGSDLVGLPLPIDALGNSLLTGTVLPDYNAVCLSCHQSAVGGLVAIDWASDIHGSPPAEPLGDDGWPLAPPYVDSSRGEYFLECIDCHEAHGSENVRLIRRAVNGAVGSETILPTADYQWRFLCDSCHLPRPMRHHNASISAKLGLDWSSNCQSCHVGSDNRPCTLCHVHGGFF